MSSTKAKVKPKPDLDAIAQAILKKHIKAFKALANY
jgi:hypothetical protein